MPAPSLTPWMRYVIVESAESRIVRTMPVLTDCTDDGGKALLEALQSRNPGHTFAVKIVSTRRTGGRY